MAALLQQMQHVLGAWDAASDGLEEHTVASLRADDGDSEKGPIKQQQERLLVTSVEKLSSANNGPPSVISVAAHVENVSPSSPNEVVKDEEKKRRTSNVSLQVPRQRQMLTKLELARAALALFTSNAGIYQPVLKKILSFVFEFIDELLNENMDLFMSKSNYEGPGVNASWGTAANDEVGMAYERMRVMEARMAKLVEEAALQRDHLRAEIVERDEREKKLSALLKHQMQLTHLAFDSDGKTAGEGHLYVKRLVARADKEQAIDELMKEVDALLVEREDLNRRVQSLLDLNGRYAVQSMELGARLSILTDHNISLAIELKASHNETDEMRRRCEKYLHELHIARNIVMSAFTDCHHAGSHWWASLHKQRLERALSESPGLRDATARTAMAQHCLEKQRQQQEHQEQTDQQEQMRSCLSPESLEEAKSSMAVKGPLHAERDDTVCRLWITPYGGGPSTPAHLRTASSVEFLRVSPVVAEHVVRALLSAWRVAILEAIEKQKPRVPLDVFAQKYLYLSTNPEIRRKKSVQVDRNAEDEDEVKERRRFTASRRSSLFLKGNMSKKALDHLVGNEQDVLQLNTTLSSDQPNELRVAYALDAVARSNTCGSLTYAFSLVGWRRVSEDLFLMLEFDRTILLALCRFLDSERCAPNPPSGLLPTVYFMAILSAMYPSYPVERLQQLFGAACSDAASMAESCMVLRYGVLLPQRMFLCSASATVEGSGALWDTGFAHLLSMHICDDVAESWQAVEDSLDAMARRSGDVASEQQLIVQALKGLRIDDRTAWSPIFRAALALCDNLRLDKARVILDDLPRMPVRDVGKYLRERLLIRRGTRPRSSSEAHWDMVASLDQQWEGLPSNVLRWDPERYAALVKRVDPLRHLAWGPEEMCIGEGANAIRHVSMTDTCLSVDTLLMLLNEENKSPVQ